MSQSKKPSKKKQVKTLGDVTINDYANSAVVTNREKKTSVNTIVKQQEIDKSWDDKDFDDIDFVATENDDGSITYELKKTITSKKPYVQTGKDYHLDIWFLISEYIRPEDIGRFSAICKTSYAAVNSAKFWFHLYKRYYKKIPGLQPQYMLRPYGVRTSVIRALYYLYPLFADRLKSIKNEEHPEVLRNRQCVLMSTKRTKTECRFSFKFKNVPLVRSTEKKPDLMEVLGDISANSEEDCRILHVTTPEFIHIPPVQGLFLTSVTINLSRGFRHKKITLGFHSLRGYKGCGDGFISVVIDPVLNLKILDWWHPLYPYNNTINYKPDEED